MKNYFLFILCFVSIKINAQTTAADSLVQIGEYQKAIENYQLDDDSDFKVARVYAQMGDVYAALDSYQKGFKIDSLSVQPRIEYARLALGNNDPVTAFNSLTSLLNDYPNNASYHYYMGKAHEDLSNDDAAISAFAKAVSLNSSYRAARVELVKILIKKRKFSEAIQNAQPALEIHSDDIKVNSLIAQAYLGAKRYDKAIEHFELLFSLGYDTEFNRKNLAWSYFYNGQWQLAIDNYELYNRDYEEGNSLVHFVMSQAYLKLGKLKLAQDYIERSIAFKTPELHQEYLQLAAVYARQEDYKNAFYATKKAKQEKKDSDFIGYQYALSGDYYFADKSKKLELYEEFIKQYPESSFQELANARAKDLRREIFLAAKK
ncbi:MAG: tetratricopeptide repeat protein [Nonlabens sp.]|uniref:tetratricopeptide repeat protein n=1 Tax=Nonlabens sp. TaxID=1888209 RepID=UPI00321A4669